jgi:DNA-binding sugar fermentation-stimulating protein
MGGSRKTGFDVIGVCLKDKVVTVDSRIPDALIHEALCAGSLREFPGYNVVRTEPAFGSGRFDFLLDPRCFVEVKSCTPGGERSSPVPGCAHGMRETPSAGDDQSFETGLQVRRHLRSSKRRC